MAGQVRPFLFYAPDPPRSAYRWLIRAGRAGSASAGDCLGGGERSPDARCLRLLSPGLQDYAAAFPLVAGDPAADLQFVYSGGIRSRVADLAFAHLRGVDGRGVTDAQAAVHVGGVCAVTGKYATRRPDGGHLSTTAALATGWNQSATLFSALVADVGVSGASEIPRAGGI